MENRQGQQLSEADIKRAKDAEKRRKKEEQRVQAEQAKAERNRRRQANLLDHRTIAGNRFGSPKKEKDTGAVAMAIEHFLTIIANESQQKFPDVVGQKRKHNSGMH